MVFRTFSTKNGPFWKKLETKFVVKNEKISVSKNNCCTSKISGVQKYKNFGVRNAKILV